MNDQAKKMGPISELKIRAVENGSIPDEGFGIYRDDSMNECGVGHYQKDDDNLLGVFFSSSQLARNCIHKNEALLKKIFEE